MLDKKNDKSRPKFAFITGLYDTIRSVLITVMRSKFGWRAIPFVIILIAISVFFVFSTLVPAVAPFVYTLF
jgi:hypothetical protein